MGMFSAKDLIAVSSSKVEFEPDQQQQEKDDTTTTTNKEEEEEEKKKPAPPPPPPPAAAAAVKPWQVARQRAQKADEEAVDIVVCATPVQPPQHQPQPPTGPLSSGKPRAPRTGPRFTKPPTPVLGPAAAPTAPPAVEEVPVLVEEEDANAGIQIFSKARRSSSIATIVPAVAAVVVAVPSEEQEPPLVRAQQSPKKPSDEQEEAPTANQEEGAEDAAASSYAGLSLDERAASGEWKARQSAYAEIGRLNSVVDAHVVALVDKAIDTEINPANLDVLLDAMIARCSECLAQPADGEDGASRSSRWIASMAKRCFAGRPSVQQRAIDLTLELVACDATAGDTVGNALVKELASKNAKVVVAALKCLRVVCASFGPGKSTVPVPCLIKAIELGVAAIPPATRAEAFALALEASAWLGEEFVALLSSKLTNDAQRRELERKWAEDKAKGGGAADKRRQPTRFRKGQSAAASATAATATAGGGGDLFDLLPAADILSKLDRAPVEFEKRLGNPEWKVRRAVLEEVELLCGKPPKLVTSHDYTPLVNALRKTVANDANQAVSVQALGVLLALSEGLRASFAFLARICLVGLLEKYREQKLVGAVDAVLDSFCHWSFQLGDDRSCQQIGETLAHAKCTPVQVLNTVKWIERSAVAFGRQKNPQVDFEPLRQLVRQHAMSHRNPNVRQAANSALNALKDGGAVAAVAVAAAAPAPPVTKPVVKPGAVAAPKVSLAVVKPTAVAVPVATRASGAAVAAVASTTSRTSWFVRQPQPLPASAASSSTIDRLAKSSPAFAQALQLGKPQQQLKALFDAVQQQTDGAEDDSMLTAQEMDDVVRFVGGLTAEWTDERLFTPLASDVLLAVLDRAPSAAALPEYVLATVLPNAVRLQQADVLTELAVVAGPHVVLHRVLLTAAAASAREVELFALDYCAACLRAFELVVFSSTDALGDVFKLLAQLYRQGGVGGDEEYEADKLALVGQVWFELAQHLPNELSEEADLERVLLHHCLLSPGEVDDVLRSVHLAADTPLPQQQVKEVWRFQEHSASSSAHREAAAEEEEEGGGGGGDEDSSTERVLHHIDRVLLPALTTADVAQWKKREDALAELEALLVQLPSLPSHSRVVLALASALCKRLDDAQRNLAARAATCIGLVCQCVGPAGSALMLKQCGVGQSLLHNLADRKPAISQASQLALTQSVVHNNNNQVSVPCLGVVLSQSLDALHKNKIDKVKLLTWLAERLTDLELQQQQQHLQQHEEESSVDQLRNVFVDYIPVLVQGFTAKEAQAKRAAVSMGEVIVSFLPDQLAQAKLRSAVRDMKVADQRMVDPIVEEVVRRGQALSRARAHGGGGASLPPQQPRQNSPVPRARVATSPQPYQQQQQRVRPVTPPVLASPTAVASSAASSRVTPHFTSPPLSSSSQVRPSYSSPARGGAQVRPSTPPSLRAAAATPPSPAPASASSQHLTVYEPPLPLHVKYERQLQLVLGNIFDFEHALAANRAEDSASTTPFPLGRDMLLLTRLESSIGFMQQHLSTSPNTTEVDETQWERMVEDAFSSSSAVLNSFDMSLKRLVASSSSGGAAWRPGAWQGKVAKLCLAGAVALTGKRSIRISLESESFTLTLIQLHPLCARDQALEQQVELAFRSVSETSSWLPTVLSLRDDPAEFVKREVRDFCHAQYDSAESPFYFVNLEECYELVSQRDNHWVDYQVVAQFRSLLGVGGGGAEGRSALSVSPPSTPHQQRKEEETPHKKEEEEEELDAGLRAIFQRIIHALENNHTDECRRGVDELRRFKRHNAELFAMLDVMVYVEGTAPLFQEYIVDKLREEPLYLMPSSSPAPPTPINNHHLQQQQQLLPPLPSTPSSEIKRRLEQMRHRSRLRMLTLPPMPMSSLDEL